MNPEGMSFDNDHTTSMYNQINVQQQQGMAARPRVDVDASGEVDPTL